jgi:hypothetical protein
VLLLPMVVIFLSAMAVLPATYTPCRACRAAAQWWQGLRDQAIPATLREWRVLKPSPEMVAHAAVQALNAGDLERLRQLADTEHPHCDPMLQKALATWPRNVAAPTEAWTTIGPYASESWYAPEPIGTLRRFPIQITSPMGQADCAIWLRSTTTGWRVVAVSANLIGQQ